MDTLPPPTGPTGSTVALSWGKGEESQDPRRYPPTPPSTVLSFHDRDTAQLDREPSADSSSDVKEVGRRMYSLPPASRPGNSVLAEDLKTPDSHVKRDARLIRLTGVHPFNVEAPLSDLFDEGFLTTKDLHYVRNHGAVPKVEDSDMMDWEFSVKGMVDKPLRLNLGRLLDDFEQVTYPVTLVCAGNRRKEQNVVRKTKGFSWGAAGVSTALWTGVVIGDVLRRAMPRRGAKYVCFEGADKLPNGHYGTSITMNWAMDPNRGVMLAHRMNGEVLHPDHGKPLRIIIPGQIGGRSVKWLTRIMVTSQPSESWYHIYDNRVLPTMIDPEMAASDADAWKDERNAIYELNTNSATCYPSHDEKISLSRGTEKYKVRGYAYAGGGRRITRVEITLDRGKSWKLAHISYPEDEYRHAPEGEMLYGGRLDVSWRESCFCWCFWDLDLPVATLAEADDILVRAMDEAMMVQPRDMYWSVLGMMNNPWFRVVIHKEEDVLRFEHPTVPALKAGGWMERVKKAGGVLTNGHWGERVAGEDQVATVEEEDVDICLTNPDVDRIISMEELRQHDNDQEPWFVVRNQVYDGTGFLQTHPGGTASITGSAGQDATEEFLSIHSEVGKGMLPKYHIGKLDEASQASLASAQEQPASDAAPREVFLQSRTWTKGILSAKKPVSADTKIFTFDLEHADQTVGLPIGQHLMMRLRDPVTREAIIRSYTPVSDGGARGRLEVLVKLYRDTAERKGGRMTQALDAIPLGHFVDFKGPTGKFRYLGRGACSIDGGGGGGGGGDGRRRVRRFVMICAGSGVTPIFQVLRAVMHDPGDDTFCLVINGNRVEEDILCRREMEEMTAGQERKCRMLYTLSQPSESWTGHRGRVGRELLEREVGPRVSADDDEMVLICGPGPLEKSVGEILKGMGWRDDDLLYF